MQFLLSKYVMPAAASRHIETNWRTVKVLELFLKNDSKDPPVSTKKFVTLREIRRWPMSEKSRCFSTRMPEPRGLEL